MKYTALRDELIEKLVMRKYSAYESGIIRCMLYKKAFDAGKSLKVADLAKFISSDKKKCLKYLDRLHSEEIVEYCGKGLEKKWFLLGAAAISRVILNPDFYKGVRVD